jgi:hypothetical protein
MRPLHMPVYTNGTEVELVPVYTNGTEVELVPDYTNDAEAERASISVRSPWAVSAVRPEREPKGEWWDNRRHRSA